MKPLPGRKLVPGRDGERSTVSIRLTKPTKDALIYRAGSLGRSLSVEVEMLIERALRDEWIIDRMREVLSEPQKLDFRVMSDE